MAPLVVSGKYNSAERLVAVDATAERLGLKSGLALAEARARYPDLAVVAEDQDADARLLDEIAEWCQRYTPLVAVDHPDGILLDITGCAHLFGGENALLNELVSRVIGCGFAACAAIASTIGTAWAAAHDDTTTIIPDGEERAFLAPLSPAALRLPGETVMALERVGLKRIGDMIDLPRAPLAARFGALLLTQLDRALGREREPLTSRLPVAAYVAEQRFAEPIAREEDVLAITVRLAGRLALVLERRGEGARLLELSLFRTDGAVRRVRAGTSRPLRDPAEIRALFVERLAALADAFDPGFGFDLARLSVLHAESAPAQQVGFGDGADADELDRLIDRLGARLGTRRVRRLIAHDSHIPELAATAVPAQAASSLENDSWTSFRRFSAAVELGPRPLRLFARPEPIEALAVVPDGPPLRFRWRRALHKVIAAEGPERIEDAWWSEDGPTRDYFRVEDTAGLRFWLFRAGLYREMQSPRWFMHGTFA